MRTLKIKLGIMNFKNVLPGRKALVTSLLGRFKTLQKLVLKRVGKERKGKGLRGHPRASWSPSELRGRSL